jgi:hypothetical protein
VLPLAVHGIGRGAANAFVKAGADGANGAARHVAVRGPSRAAESAPAIGTVRAVGAAGVATASFIGATPGCVRTTAGLIDAAHGEAATRDAWGLALATAALAIDAGDAPVSGAPATVLGVGPDVDALSTTLRLANRALLFGASTGGAIQGPPPPAGGDAPPLALDGTDRARLAGGVRRHLPLTRPMPRVPLRGGANRAGIHALPVAAALALAAAVLGTALGCAGRAEDAPKGAGYAIVAGGIGAAAVGEPAPSEVGGAGIDAVNLPVRVFNAVIARGAAGGVVPDMMALL